MGRRNAGVPEWGTGRNQRQQAGISRMSNVTSIMDRLPGHGPLRHAETRRLFRYWEQLRGERPAPDKEELDLKHLGPMLPWLALLQRRTERADGALGDAFSGEDTAFVWRLMGSGLVMLLGAGLEDQEAFAGWEAFERGTLGRMLRNVVMRHQPFVAQIRLIDAIGRLKVEMLALPVHSRVDGATLALVAMIPLEEHYLTFGPARRGELLSLRSIWTVPVPGPGPSRRVAGDSRENAGSAPRASSGAGFAPFTVIEGGLSRR